MLFIHLIMGKMLPANQTNYSMLIVWRLPYHRAVLEDFAHLFVPDIVSWKLLKRVISVCISLCPSIKCLFLPSK